MRTRCPLGAAILSNYMYSTWPSCRGVVTIALKPNIVTVHSLLDLVYLREGNVYWILPFPSLYPPNEFAGPEEERKGPSEHRRLYLGRTISLSFLLPPLIAACGAESASGGQ